MNAQRTNTIGVGVKLVGLTLAAAMATGLGCSDGGNAPTGKGGSGGATAGTTGSAGSTGGSTAGTGGSPAGTGGSTTGTGGSAGSTGGSTAGTGGSTGGSTAGTGGSTAGTGGHAGTGGMAGTGGNAGAGGNGGTGGPANLPPTLNVPSGATLKLHLHATGDQVYTCTASAAGGTGGSGSGGAGGSGATTYAWVLKQPDAKLYDASNAQVGTHGLGPNWTSTDGSVVNGAKAYQESSPTAGAIPWLLLRATSNTGTGVFSDVTYVQRVNTTGGVAPATGCDSTTVGTDTRAPYTADYYFYTGGGAGTAWLAPPANLPPTLNVPSGATLKIHDHAIGVQVYTCTATAAGGAGGGGGAGGSGATTYAWVLKQPDAVLYDSSFAQVGTHGLGPNWTSTDASVVNGAKAYQESSPAAGAIPWLLLRATSNTGTGVFSDVTYVQRVNTAGGPAPSGGCDATTTADVRIPYSADYYFYSGGGPGTAWTTPPANLPTAIAVPSGATFALHYHAIGVQVYTCTASAAGGAGGSGAGGAGGSGATTYAWVLKQPDAVLYDASFAQAGTHGLGPNWTSSDGSVVNGAKVAGVNSTATGAIQWLLLMATSNTGTGVLSNITYVQRLNTAGGPAPATGCDATTTADVRIPYSADYYFFTGGTTTADGGTNG